MESARHTLLRYVLVLSRLVDTVGTTLVVAEPVGGGAGAAPAAAKGAPGAGATGAGGRRRPGRPIGWSPATDRLCFVNLGFGGAARESERAGGRIFGLGITGKKIDADSVGHDTHEGRGQPGPKQAHSTDLLLLLLPKLPTGIAMSSTERSVRRGSQERRGHQRADEQRAGRGHQHHGFGTV